MSVSFCTLEDTQKYTEETIINNMDGLIMRKYVTVLDNLSAEFANPGAINITNFSAKINVGITIIRATITKNVNTREVNKRPALNLPCTSKSTKYGVNTDCILPSPNNLKNK